MTISVPFSPEDLARIDRAAELEGLELAVFLQRAAILGIKEALREYELVQFFERLNRSDGSN